MANNTYFLDQINDAYHYDNYTPEYLNNDNKESLNERATWDPNNKEFTNPTTLGPNVVELKLPVNPERDFKGCNSLNERKERMENKKAEYVSLFVNPDFSNDINYSNFLIWVKLPKEDDGINYVPIIILDDGGIDFYPGTHKYFLRSFDKKIRHLILGFCSVYGLNIENECYFAGKNKGMFKSSHLDYFERISLYYKDNEAPKRIDLGRKK